MICVICRKPEGDHHEFKAYEMPPGCVCDPRTWEPTAVNDICRKYEGNGFRNCSNCEHDRECHDQHKKAE